MKIQRKVRDERVLYLGLLPPGKVSASTRTLSCTLSSPSKTVVKFGAPYEELWDF